MNSDNWVSVYDSLPKASGRYLCWLCGFNGLTGKHLNEPVVCSFDKATKSWGNFFEVCYWQEIIPPVQQKI